MGEKRCIDCGKKIDYRSTRCNPCAKAGKNHPMWGKRASLETRTKLSQARRGNKHYNWKGGRAGHGDGRVRIYAPDNEMASMQGYVYESRLVMSHHLGRPLSDEEVVHHINGDPADNRKQNLALFGDQREHICYHARTKQGRFL